MLTEIQLSGILMIECIIFAFSIIGKSIPILIMGILIFLVTVIFYYGGI